jgi:hypothetical protein
LRAFPRPCFPRRIVNFADPTAADRARQVLNGMRAGDKVLQVTLQQPVGPLSGPVPPPGSAMMQPANVGFADGGPHTGSPLSLAFPGPPPAGPADWQSLVAMPPMSSQLSQLSG